MRAWPVSERCFARDNCSRKRSLYNSMPSAHVPSRMKIGVLITEFLGLGTILQPNYIKMTARSLIGRIVEHEDINFWLTNRLPRRWLTQFIGWLSRIEHPWVCAACMSLWRVFSDLDLRDAKQSRFKSLHECFTRELRQGARPIDTDPEVVSSPCDAIVGACRPVRRCKPRASRIRCRIFSATPNSHTTIAAGSSPRCGSRLACTTAFM